MCVLRAGRVKLSSEEYYLALAESLTKMGAELNDARDKREEIFLLSALSSLLLVVCVYFCFVTLHHSRSPLTPYPLHHKISR